MPTLPSIRSIRWVLCFRWSSGFGWWAFDFTYSLLLYILYYYLFVKVLKRISKDYLKNGNKFFAVAHDAFLKTHIIFFILTLILLLKSLNGLFAQSINANIYISRFER